MRSGKTTLEGLQVVVVYGMGYFPDFVVCAAPVTQSQWNAVQLIKTIFCLFRQ